MAPGVLFTKRTSQTCSIRTRILTNKTFFPEFSILPLF